MRPDRRGGYGLDALWNDDFHHTARGRADRPARGLLHDYRGTPQELISAAKYGFLYQGQWYAWQKKRARHAGLRSAAVRVRHLPREPRPGRELRVRAAAAPARRRPGGCRALTALLLLGRGRRCCSRGRSSASSAPFLYFADHKPELQRAGQRGTARVPGAVSEPARSGGQSTRCPSPATRETFERCKLDPARARARTPTRSRCTAI